MMGTAIRFVRGWMGNPVGKINTTMNVGAMHELVKNGVAEWYSNTDQQTPTNPAPVASVAPSRPQLNRRSNR